MRNLTILIFVLILAICSAFIPPKRSLVGLYGECLKYYYACTQLELKSDSTFEYYVFFDVGGEIINEGTWTVDRDTLILNTYNQPAIERGYRILDSTPKDIKEIYCFDRDSFPNFMGQIVINGTDTLPFDDDGKVLYDSDIHDVRILGPMTQNSRFTVPEKDYSGIVFFVDFFVCHSPHYLTDEKLIIERKGIREYYHCHERFADDVLKKTKMKNKRF